MPVTKLYLVRHGQSAGNAEGRFGGHGPTPLSDLGRRQAEITAEALARENVDAVYSSDLYRAVQTAEPLGRLTGIPVHTKDAFRERHVGVNRHYHHVITRGESYRQLVRRSMNELWEILRKHHGGRIAVFSHTGAICFMTLHLMGAIRRDTKQTPWLITSNCGINRFEIRGRNNVRVLALNDTRHLMDITGNDSFGAR